MNQMYDFYPVYMDPIKMPKDMNKQNIMFFPPLLVCINKIVVSKDIWKIQIQKMN